MSLQKTIILDIMTTLDIKPIRNLKADGNSIVDVVIYNGDLWVRVINYKEYQNNEILIAKDSNPDDMDFGKLIKHCISSGLKYCLELDEILTLSDLSKESIMILRLLKEGNWLKIKALQKMTALSEESIRNAIDHLLDKYLITRVGFEKYAYQDRYGHLRDYFTN